VASLLHVGLGNAAAATALALAAGALCLLLRGRRPAIAHALWLLVLLKLLTPPLWSISLSVPVSAPASATPEPATEVASVHTPRAESVAAASPEDDRDERPAFPKGVEVAAAHTAPVDSAPEPAVHHRMVREYLADLPAAPHWLPAALGSAWLAGSVGCLALVVIRSWRFRRVLRHATPAAASVKRRAAQLAGGLGVGGAHGPDVWFVPGAVCPMLWAPLARPARLLLPAGLWDDLGDAERDTLIVHELAHLRRRDHWVRLVEIAATVLYWWLPVVWWARRQLREAEEQCCDAWVVWSMPRAARHYMTAILQAVEFVSEGLNSPRTGDGAPRAARAAVAVPPMACGMAAGDFRQLKRRLTMIRENETDRRHASRTLGSAGVLAVCAGAMALLPMAPSLAQVETAPVGASGPVAEAPQATPRPVQVQAGIELRAPQGTPTAESPAPVSVSGPNGQIVQIQPAGELRVRSVDPAGHVATIRGAEIRLTPAAPSVDEARAEVERLSQALAEAKDRLAQLEQSGGNRAPDAVSSYRLTPSATPRSRATAPRAENSGPSQDRSNRRLDEMERKLDRLLDEVERLKQGRQSGKRGADHPATSAAPTTELPIAP
jgi:beta-lactamase regulating signal transducer with metallopeptidase domain